MDRQVAACRNRQRVAGSGGVHDEKGILRERVQSGATLIARFYRWIFRLAGQRQAVPVLATMSFLESSVFPIPPDAVLAPMVIATPQRAYRLAAICSLASVLGGVAGYFIGVYAFDQIGSHIISYFSLSESFKELTERYSQLGGVAILVAAITPFPYKAVTIFSGAAGFPLLPFILFSTVGRTARFMLVAFIMKRFGDPMRRLIERRALEVTIAAIAAGLALLAWAKFH